MSFIETYDPKTGKRKRNTVEPKAQIAKNAITDHNYTQGKSSDQGNRGMQQGNEGWKSQYGGNGNAQTNSIIDSLSRSPQQYETPKVTADVTSQKGFNQILSVIGARNNAKLDMQNRKVQQGVLGSLMQSQTQRDINNNRIIADIANTKQNNDARERMNTESALNRLGIAKMNDATQRRGQDRTADYYQGTLENQVRGQDMRREDALINAGNKNIPKPVSQLDEQVKRQKIIESVGDDFWEQMVGAEEWDEMGSDQQQEVKSKYLFEGERAVAKIDHSPWFDDTVSLSYGDSKQQPNVSTQAEQKQPVATGKLFDGLAKKYDMDRGQFKLSNDGKSIVFPDGSESPLENVLSGLGG